MQKILMAGDTHGDFRNVKHKIDKAVEHGIQRIVILGDFGLWWGFDGVKFIDEINAYAAKHNRQIFAIPGNHENYDWWNSAVANAKKSQATSHGWAYLRTNVLLSPRVHEFRWNHKQFVVAGGAVSIDRASRLEYERHKGKRAWSPDEQLSEGELESLMAMSRGFGYAGVKTDYLLTHDCSNKTPFYSRLKPDIDSEIHRKRIDSVLKGFNPKFHFHGHMHTRYDWMNFVGEKNGEAVYVQTYGLECNNDWWSWGVLDLGTDEFVWGPDLN